MSSHFSCCTHRSIGFSREGLQGRVGEVKEVARQPFKIVAVYQDIQNRDSDYGRTSGTGGFFVW